MTARATVGLEAASGYLLPDLWEQSFDRTIDRVEAVLRVEPVLLGYRDPRELSGAYDVAGHQATLEQMTTLLDELATEAAS